MLYCECELIGMADLMFGKHVDEDKRDDETHNQKEARTWQQKVHAEPSGQLFWPAMALKNNQTSAAKWLSLRIPGEGAKTYTKRFMAAFVPADKLLLTKPDGSPLTMDDIDPIKLFVPSDGTSGSGKRVPRIFPTLHEWQTVAKFYIFDNKITEEVLFKHLVTGGRFIGFGSMRAENNGINGRWRPENLMCKEMDADEAVA